MAEAPDAAITARLADAGLHRVSLSAFNEMGRVNAWIVDDDPLTLVDAGTRAPESLRALEAAFAAIGRRIEDVGLVVLTHQHTDHVGLAAEVVRRSGAEVAALAPLVPYLGDLEAQATLDRAYMVALLRRHGADAAAVAGNDEGWTAFHALAEPVRVTVPLVAGARLPLRSRTLEVLHRPGHSETDVLLVDGERRLAIGGDHLLAAAPSVPVRDRPLGGPGGGLPDAEDDLAVLPRYRASLRATRGLPVDLVLPGHGEAFGDVAATVDAHLARQERTAHRLLRRTTDGPVAAFDLVRAAWPDAPPAMAFPLLGNVLGTLGLLREQRLVEQVAGDDGAPRYAATGR